MDRALRTGAEPDRLASPPSQGGTAKLTFYFDYSSPWAFLGYMRLEKMLASVAPMKVKMEFVPILLGALFKQLGTPNVSTIGLPATFHYFSLFFIGTTCSND